MERLSVSPLAPGKTPHLSIGARLKILARIIYSRVHDLDTFQQAAALSYHTLFSLLPVFVLIVLVLSMISGGSEGGIDKQVQNFIFQQFQLDALTITDDATGDDLNVTGMIARQIEHARNVVANPVTGLVGFAILVYAASKIMLVIESAFNRIFGAASARSWSRRVTLYWCVLTLGPLLVAASLAATDVFFRYASSYSYGRALLAPLSIIAGFVVSWVLMIVLYKVVPGTHVGWAPALSGGFVGALLWEIGKNAFGIYVRQTVGGANWYGTLALLPLFMFWIYLTWVFILLGLHIAYVHQFYRVLVRRQLLMKEAKTSITDLRWVLPLSVLLLQRFRAGKATLAHEAADELNLPTETIDDFLHGLQKVGIVHCIDTRTGGYVLARPPEAITAQELIHAAKAVCALPAETVNLEHDPQDPAHTPALVDLEAHVSAWYRSHTLADLAAPKGV